uniref:AC4 n=1 Tax=Bean golden yellow mosaic virus TaxID=220340 RepID=A0A1P8NTT5_9GEMI|nr:AC4 [Bean golden yellow mosaic virus]UMP08215.1 ac4 [Bean golden yellow mosaic virus]
MVNPIFMRLFSSKVNSSAQIKDCSTWYPQPGQHISIRTFRELNQVQTSRNTSTKMESQSNGDNSKSTADLQEEVSSLPTTHMQRH